MSKLCLLEILFEYRLQKPKRNFVYVAVSQITHETVMRIYVTSFLVFHTKVTVNIGLKEVVR